MLAIVSITELEQSKLTKAEIRRRQSHHVFVLLEHVRCHLQIHEVYLLADVKLGLFLSFFNVVILS